MVQLVAKTRNLCFRQTDGNPIILNVRVPVDRAAREALWRKYFRQKRDRGTGKVTDIEPTKEEAKVFARELFLLTVAGWNIDGADGNRLPLNESTYEDMIGLLPSAVGQAILQVAFNDPLDEKKGAVYFADSEADIAAHEGRDVAGDVDPKG